MIINERKRDNPFSEAVPDNHGKQPRYDPSDPPRQTLALPLYLDYNRDTPLDPKVSEAVENHNFNTSSSPIIEATKSAVNEALDNIAKMISASRNEIVLTSGSIECGYNVILSARDMFFSWYRIQFPKKRISKTHIISTKVEPVESNDFLRRFADEHRIDVTYVPVDRRSGQVLLKDILSAIIPTTFLITISYVTPATGIIQPVKDISLCLNEIGKSNNFYRPLLHSDIANALGKMEVDVKKMNLDYATISGDKIYAPKIGALYHNQKLVQDRLFLPDLMIPEEELKIKVKAVIGLGLASLLIPDNLNSYVEHFTNLKAHFEKELVTKLGMNVTFFRRAEAICNVSCMTLAHPEAFKRLTNKHLLIPNIEFAIIGGVRTILKDSGYPSDLAKRTLSISFGRPTTVDDLSNFVLTLSRVIFEDPYIF